MLRMGAVTVRLSVTLTVCPALSVTWKPRQPNVPVAVGIPINFAGDGHAVRRLTDAGTRRRSHRKRDRLPRGETAAAFAEHGRGNPGDIDRRGHRAVWTASQVGDGFNGRRAGNRLRTSKQQRSVERAQ